MSRHLADKRKPSSGLRMREFLRIARESGDEFWKGMTKRHGATPPTNRRAVEYIRIARGRQV